MLKTNDLFLHMSNGQLRTNGIEDGRLLAAMSDVRRENFVPSVLSGSAYVDEDLPLGHDRYMLEPLVLATLLSRAGILPHDHVLVIGGGYGYSAAVIAHLASLVVMLEEHEDLAVEARGRLSGQGRARIEVVHGPLAEGWTAERPYDVILIEGAVEVVSPSLSGQLREGGRLVSLEVVSGRPGSTSALCRYLTMERVGNLFPTRYEGDAFVHRLPAFARPPLFSL